VESLKIITEKASTRIARFAFEYARRVKRKKIHAIHKANIMKLSDGLFIRCSRNISKEYPEIYGDIISDLCAAFVGGLGVVPGANFGHECAIFEAVHGSAPDIAGKDIANPTAVLRSGILMLRHLGEENAANHIRAAIEKVFSENKHLTRDLGGTAGTTEFADAMIEVLHTIPPPKPQLQEVEL
jgi:isocitrate dehydrogenase (NAD+)